MDRWRAGAKERFGLLVSPSLSAEWYSRFIETMQGHEASARLREAAIRGQLGRWTEALTSVVCATCGGLGWEASAKGHISKLLPVPRSEYLVLDVVAFEASGERRWRFPVAAFELENSTDDDRVAYSLWKVLCIRAKLRVVFCYRRDANQGNDLVRHLSEQVAHAMELQDRAALTGDTVLVVGSRSEAATFPYGFFKNWLFDANVGKFARS
jgi:hypothetical protein